MATLYITEYPAPVSINGVGGQVAQEPSIADQTVAIAAGHAESAAFNPSTRLVRLHTDAICSVLFGTAPVATATTRRMAAGQTEWFVIPRNQSYKVSVITNT